MMGSEMPARCPTTASGCWRGDIVRSLFGRSVARSTAGQLLSDENFTVDGMLLEGCEFAQSLPPGPILCPGAVLARHSLEVNSRCGVQIVRLSSFGGVRCPVASQFAKQKVDFSTD
jgi:hypothetical protein